MSLSNRFGATMSVNEYNWRRFSRKMLLWTGVLLLLVVSAAAVFATIWDARASRRLEEIFSAYGVRGEPINCAQLQERYRASTPVTNAASHFEAAFALCDEEDPEKASTARVLPLVGTGSVLRLEDVPTPEMLQQIEKYLAHKQHLLALAKEAAAMDQCVFAIDLSKGINKRLPHLKNVRKCAHILALKNVRDVSRQDGTSAVENVAVMFKLADSVRREPVMLSSALRLLVLDVAVQNTERIVSYCQLPDQYLGRLSEYAKLESDLSCMREIWIGERCETVTLIDDLLRQKPLRSAAVWMEWFGEHEMRADYDETRQIPSTKYLAQACVLRSLGQGYARDKEIESLRVFDELVSASTLPPQSALLKYRELEKREQGLSDEKGADLLMRMCISSALYSKDRWFRTHQSLVLMNIACAVEMYRNTKGSLPDSLEMLAQQYVDRVPDDVFGDGKIKYRKEEKGYILWSVSSDGQDNNGTVVDGRAYRTGSDIVFRVLR